jgi:hypothetical protein
MIINVKDTISKINGVFTASIYTLYSLVLSLVASIRLIQQFLVTAIFVLVAGIALAIGIGWLFPPMFALIVPGITLATILMLVIASMSKSLLGSFNISSNPRVPNIPTFCFDKNTILTMKDNTKKYIKDIKLGDILHDGSIVEAFMVSNSKNNIMYKLNNIIVSSKHKIFSKKLGWINVEDHPLSIKIDNYNEPFIYCLSTNSKIINIDNITFSDWDELDDIDVYNLKEKFNFIKDFREINKLNCCFHPDTELLMNNNKKINIKNIKVGDILHKNNEVLSIIKIKSDKLNFKEYKFKKNDMNIKASSNIIFNNYNDIRSKKINSPNIGYNIITSKGYISYDYLEINDYINSGIDLYLP